jgi:hypothetical protein
MQGCHSRIARRRMRVGSQTASIRSASIGPFGATPQVRFAKALQKFVLVYPQNQNSVWIRFADNLFEWSAAQPLYVATDPVAKVLYASAVGRGHDPTILGSDFYVYFVTGQVLQFQNIWTGPNGTFVREEVIVGRKTHQGPGSDEDGEDAQ